MTGIEEQWRSLARRPEQDAERSNLPHQIRDMMPDPSIPSIAVRAYELWEAAGRPDGRDEEFYFQAEEELRQFLERDLGEAAQKQMP